MKRRMVSAMTLMLLLTSMLMLAFNIQTVKGGTITVPDDYPTIQDAVNAASENDTVFVRNGTYYENVVVNKTMSLVGENAQSTVIDRGGSGNVVNISANGVNVSGFTIRNSGGPLLRAGITLESVSHCNIAGNNITANNYGVYLYYSSNNTVSGNNITNNNLYGIWVGDSSNNSISGNNITSNNGDGIQLSYSSNNSISGNNITSNNGDGILVHGSDDLPSSDNSIVGNIIKDNSEGIWLHESLNISIVGNGITNNEIGIELDYSSGNSIVDNSITNNSYYGIMLWPSSDNSIVGNIIKDNSEGIWLHESLNNRFYHNNFIGNTQQVYSDDGYANAWDNGYPSGGNYWSDYNGTDANQDGIGDTPYVIDANNTDNYPLMVQYVIPEFPSFLVPMLLMIATLLAVTVYRRRIDGADR
jgi:parallel beta-helix repeat protein